MDKKIAACVTRAISDKVFPGAVVGYIASGKKTVLPFGRLTYNPDSPAVIKTTMYDVASITKSMPVSSIVLQLCDEGTLSLDDPVVRFVPELQCKERDTILVRHLLTFSVAFDLPHSLSWFASLGAQAVLQAIFTAPLQFAPGTAYCYSNAPSILLGLVIERITSKALDVVANERFFRPLGMEHTTFHPEQFDTSRVAPTEITQRGEIQGQVHDESAWALNSAGIVPGHAGVFSVADDLLQFAAMLLANGTLDGRQYFTPETVAAMHTNQLPQLNVAAGLGWELGQPRFMGTRASTQCFGKIGFTGPVILIDPSKQRCMVLLCNRTYPHRPADGTAINNVRCQLADIIFA